jgi:[ribosomal protein S5]-alanine N-acetyltransferase
MRPRTAAPLPTLRTTLPTTPPTERLLLLRTERLLLRASNPALAGAVAAYLKLNRAAHAPWNPPMREAVFTVAGQRERLAAAAKVEAQGTQIGWFLSPIDDEQRVIGHLRFSQIARGPFCNAMLGYAIGTDHQGRGLMREALAAAIADVFSARVGLHRVQANARPENTRSLALLERLGFVREGLAHQYLFIDGAWRDHVLTALVNPAWAVDRAP